MLVVKYLTFMEIGMENDFWKFIVGLIVFFGILFGALSYSSTLRTDCKMLGMEKGYSAIEIQGICGTHD
jgi:hypothetical protein